MVLKFSYQSEIVYSSILGRFKNGESKILEGDPFMRVDPRGRRLQTTVGDLVVAAMDAALEVSKDQRKAHRLAGIVLNKILSDSRLSAHRFGRDLSKKTLLH